jgi:hypothetical protein
MKSVPAIQASTGAMTLMLIAAGSAFAAPGTPRHEIAGSVVSLLAPAHGSAFAFGAPGHLLTTRRAVGSGRRVEVLLAGGRTALATVTSTTDSAIVQLRDVSGLVAIRGTGLKRAGTAVRAQSGPLGGMVSEVGTVPSAVHRATTLRSGSAFEGAPIVDARGGLVGVATVNGRHLDALNVRGLRALAVASPQRAARSSGFSALATLAIVFAFGIGVGVARLVLRTRVQRKLATRELARRPGPATQPQASQAAAPMEPDTGVHVVLRRRESDGPPPDVRLRRRPSVDEPPARESSQQSPGAAQPGQAPRP